MVGALMARWKRWALPGLVLALSAPALAAGPWAYALDSGSSDVSARVAFLGLASKTARFPAMSGQVTLLPGQPGAIALDVSLDARALRAGDGVTADRLKGPAFFDVTNHPVVRFSGRTMRRTGPRTADVSGELTARGVTRPQVLKVTFERDILDLSAQVPVGLVGRMTIDRRAYGMTAWGGIVGNKVDIAIRTRMLPE